MPWALVTMVHCVPPQTFGWEPYHRKWNSSPASHHYSPQWDLTIDSNERHNQQHSNLSNEPPSPAFRSVQRKKHIHWRWLAINSPKTVSQDAQLELHWYGRATTLGIDRVSVSADVHKLQPHWPWDKCLPSSSQYSRKAIWSGQVPWNEKSSTSTSQVQSS